MSGKKKKCYFSKRNIDGVRFFPIPQWTMGNPIIFLCYSFFVIIGCVQFHLGIFHSFAREYLAILKLYFRWGKFEKKKRKTSSGYYWDYRMGPETCSLQGKGHFRRQGKCTRMGSKHFINIEKAGNRCRIVRWSSVLMTTMVSSRRQFSCAVLYGLVLCTELPNVLCGWLGRIHIIDGDQKMQIWEQRKICVVIKIRFKTINPDVSP